MMSDKTMISLSFHRYNSGNRDYLSHFFSDIYKTAKFLIVFVRLISGKVEDDVFTGTQRESDIR